MATFNVSTAAGRARLKPRREPYFVRIAKGQHLGFRRLEEGGTWIARYQAGEVRRYRALGTESQFATYKAVLEAALTWFTRQADEDRPNFELTVAKAVEAYLRDLRLRKSADAARRAGLTARKHILPALGALEVERLTTRRLSAWRDALVCDDGQEEEARQSKDTANRILTILKAALNLVFREGSVSSDAAWRRVKPFKDVGRARDVFLSERQCAALIKACDPDFGALVKSALLTGGRYGELARRRVADLDLAHGTLRVPDGKTKARTVTLSDAAIDHFRQLAKDKLPKALVHSRLVTGINPETGEPVVLLKEWGESVQTRRMKRAIERANQTIDDPKCRLPAETCFYSLRHTHASLALIAGVNIQILAENMGTSVRMIEKHYGKFLHADRRAMFNALPSFSQQNESA